MRSALARLGGPIRRRLRRDVTDDAQGLVSSEKQPEVELSTVASTSGPEVVYQPSDRPTKNKTIFVKLVNVRKSLRRRKSTSGSDGKGQRDRKENKTDPEIDTATSPATSCSGLFETELDRLIEVAEPEVETPITDDVTSAEAPRSSAAILHSTEPEEDQTDRQGEKAKHSRRVSNDGNLEREAPASGPEVDDVTIHPAEDDEGIRQQEEPKKHRKRKRAKRYARRVCIFNGNSEQVAVTDFDSKLLPNIILVLNSRVLAGNFSC